METSLTWLGRLTGSPSAGDWKQLLDVYGPLLAGWLAKSGVPATDRDDLVQEVLMVVVRRVSEFDRRGPGAFRAWLRQILANHLKKYFRDRPASGPAVDLDAVAAADHEDLTQEVLMVVVRRVGEFDRRGPGAFRAWLRAIVANHVRKYFRGRASAPEVDLDAVAAPDSVLGRAWDREHDEHLAARAMRLVEGDFAPATWAAFRRQVIDGVPPAAVAAELGLSLNAAILAKSRVLKRLREELRGLVE